MKKQPFRYLALCLAFLLLLSGVAFADEPTATAPAAVETPAPVVSTPEPSPEVSTELDPAIEPENAFVSALSNLFGPYTPRTRTVTTTQANGTVMEVQEPVPGLAGLDWPWLASVALFSVVLVCLFKLVGVVAKK